MRLILHVGLPKTATTTIQHVMDTAKPELAAQGVLYPGTTGSQVELVRRAQLRQYEGESGPSLLAEAMGWVAAEVREHRPEHVVLSCERMALASDGAVARMQRAIATWLPEVNSVGVLAYVRDPVSWATSLCLQRLKMGTTRLAQFAADPWPLGLEAMLGKFVRRYGNEAVAVRHMHPDHLQNGDVVDDFLARIGLPRVVSGQTPVLNRSLTLHGAQVADVIADHLPRGFRKGARRALVRRLLEDIEGPRFVLPREVQAQIIEASRGDVEYVYRLWGLDIRPKMIDPTDAPTLDEQETLERAAALLEELERQAEIADSLDEGADGT